MFDISSGKVISVSGDISHRQSLKNILHTNILELLGDPAYGADLKSSLFELQSGLTQRLIQNAISEAAAKYVPQVRISAVAINTSYNASDSISIVVNYYTIDTGETNFLELVVLSDGSLTTR
jgi:phage baseplate assembly protein W